MPNASHRLGLGRAVILGAASGLRTMAAPAALAGRGRWGSTGRIAVLTAAAGEMTADKLPFIPPRSDPPALAGRAVAASVAGREIAGAAGAGAAAAGSLASTYVSERLRSMIVAKTGIPDPAVGVAEDALALVAAFGATRPANNGQSEARHAGGPEPDAPTSPLIAAARGLAAAAAGTAAMTSVQTAYLKLTDGTPSTAPEQVGRRIIEGLFNQRVPRQRRPALNQAMHALYGTTWGIPFGLVVGSLRRRPPATLSGAALGLTAWAVSLVQLPALGVSPPPWRQPPGSLAGDAIVHLVFGGATAATFRALSA